MINSDPGTQISPKERPSEDASSSEQTATAVIGGVVGQKGRAKASSLDNIGQLFRAVYTGAFKRSTLKRAELSAMRTGSELDESEREEILNLALSDRILDRTRKLMLLGISLDTLTVGNQIREFAGEVLRRHPAFRMKSMTDALANLPEGTTEDRAVRILASQDYTSLAWPEGIEPTKKKESEQCKANAVYCLLLWFWATRGTSVDRIQRYMQENLWKSVTRRYNTEAEKLHVLASVRDPAAASVTSALLEQRALKENQRAEAAQRAEERAVTRMQELNKQLADLDAKLEASKAEVGRLGKKIMEECQAHADDRAHLKNDYEQLRGRVLRRLKDELSLLDEGLHALRREPPKVHVMVDHAERAVDGLKREMERLRRSS